MAIGEFGGAPAVPGDNGVLLSTPLYWFYEMSHAALNPSRAWADATQLFFKNPVNPLSFTTFGKSVAAACELFERSTRRYGRPEWRIDSTLVGGERVPVHISTVWERPFCKLIHFERVFERPPKRPQPRLLIVAPMSGHYRIAAARHGRGVSAQPRRLRHRLGRCAHGAAVGRTLRSRRLYRLRDFDPACARRRHPRHRGVPAVGPGHGRGGAHGGRRRSLCADIDDADGRADRYAGQSDRREQSRRKSAASIGSAATSSPRCRFRIPASCATSIRAFCSSTASSA